jgi:uncharacterized protein Yka (UPF0111/DUF47 family)
MDVPEASPYILNDITQIVTAIGVILTAVSSIMNRMKLDKVDRKFDQAVQVAVDTKNQAAETAQKAVAKLEDVRKAAVAVNAEVVKEVHDAGVQAGKEIAGNGKH